MFLISTCMSNTEQILLFPNKIIKSSFLLDFYWLTKKSPFLPLVTIPSIGERGHHLIFRFLSPSNDYNMAKLPLASFTFCFYNWWAALLIGSWDLFSISSVVSFGQCHYILTDAMLFDWCHHSVCTISLAPSIRSDKSKSETLSLIDIWYFNGNLFWT